MSFTNDKISGLRIKDEGITIANPAQSLDFVGAGVSATVIGSDVTVNIGGTGSGPATNEVRNEPLTIAASSATLAHTPIAGTLSLYLNGNRMKLNVDYTLSGATVTFIIDPSADPDVPPIVLADYYY